MSPKEHSLCHQNNAFSKCPIKNCVITVVILGVLPPLMTGFAQEHIKNNNNSSFPSIQTSGHYLPTDTETESQQSTRLLPGTKGSSTSGTTSTVRPWPSHNFFRYVLSRSDNVVTKKKNRSTSKQKPDQAGISSRNGSTFHLKEQNRVDKELHLNTTDKGDPTLDIASLNGTRARSVLMLKPTETRDDNNGTISKRQFSSPAHEFENSQTVPEPMRESGINQQTANVTTPSQAEDFEENGMNINQHEFSPRINSPQVGFQYEILMPPPPVLPPRPTPFKLTATLNLRPSSTAISTMLQPESHYDSSGSNSSSSADDGASKNNRNTSNFTISAVNADDMGKRNVTNDDATTTTTPSPPLPLGSQLEESKNAETAEAAATSSTTLLPAPLAGSYNKSNEIILQYPQYPSAALLPSPPPPTQPLQLDTFLVKGNSVGERATYSNKSHLPHSLEGDSGNVSEIHVEIKRNDPWTINHNSGNSTDSSANKESPGETTTFLPILKRDRKQNSSSVNTLTTLVSPITTTFPSFTTTWHAWKAQPTHFSFHSTNQPTSNYEQTLTDGPGNMSTEKTFRKRISQHTSDENQKEINSANANYPFIHNQKPVMKSQTALINRRNMFTVVKAGITNPRIRVESRNVTTTTTTTTSTTTAASRLKVKSSTMKSAFPGRYPSETVLYDRTNQVERPSLTTSILAGPDRMMVSMSPGHAGKDNDYFDEDDAQTNLHHWIETEQGHFVTPSTELPRFTNLTWPYNIPTAGSSGNAVKGGGGGGSSMVTGNAATGSAATALSVSFKGQQQQKQDKQGFNNQFEFYIPSAAADPQQNPILLAKTPTTANKIAHATSPYEFWTRIPTIEASTRVTQQLENAKQGLSNLKQSDHKSKIKHSHWGSKGLSSMKPQNSDKVKPPVSANTVKVYESSTGSPKSTPSAVSPITFTKAPASTFTITSNKQQHHTYFSTSTFPTSPSSSHGGSSGPVSSDTGEIVGQTETASFVTSKTPTNIWYKPIINHFTASVPFPGNASLLDSLNDQIFKNVQGIGGGTFVTTTMQPPSTRRKGYVGGGTDAVTAVDDDDDTFSVNTNKMDKITFPGKFTSSRRNTTFLDQNRNDSENPILFKVWNLVDGKLKLENQREIPNWALHGYVIPASGTILNLQQIPPALQPLVTSAMAMNRETTELIGSGSTTNSPTSYVWKPLPIRGSHGSTSKSSSSVSTTSSITASTTTTVTSITPDGFDNNGSNRIKIAASQMGWHSEAESETMHSISKQPISINYVLWNNPASIYGQSIILSTPSPQTLLSHQPTPLSYFPSSTITPVVENTTPLFSVPSVVTIKNPSGSSSTSSSYTTTTTQRTSPLSSTVDHEKLELLFQNYFQYFITTSTPAPTTTTTTTTLSPISLANKVVGTYGQDEDNSKAWKDLKKLILRLASAKNDNDNKASATLDTDKTGDLDYLGNVAAIALIMSYLRNQYEKGSVVTSSTTPVPYGVTDDMTPPNKDQLWATVYPLFQHFLNNPNYTFIPPPPKSSNQQLLSASTSSMGSMTPTSPGPIPFNEPPSVTGSSNYYGENTEYNHYASYYPTITTPRTATSVSHISITDVSWHGATPGKAGRSSEEQPSDLDVSYLDYETTTTTHKPKTLLVLKKLKNKGKKKKKKKNDSVKKPIFRTSLLKKLGGPLFHIKKKPKKYWLDLKFEVDFIDLIKKKLLFMLAYKYMPVVMVLAFGVTPIILSLVPLLYKMLWHKWKQKKYIKVHVPVPKPYPVFRPPPPRPPFLYGRHHHSPPLNEHLHRPVIRYENEHPHNDDVIHVDSPPQLSPTPLIMDHHYAADTMVNGNGENSNEEANKYAYKNLQLPERENGGDYSGIQNSFNYDYVKHSTPDAAIASTHAKYPHNLYGSPNQDQEIHVHLHDEESQHFPRFQQAPPPTYSPSSSYTSYTQKDLQPYPVTKGYEMGYNLGQSLAGITNKHDMEIFKILVETKKEKLNKLLDMWNLAKYGAAVASDAAVNTVNALRGSTTPTYPEGSPAKKKKRKRRRRRRRRKKRKHPIEASSSTVGVPSASGNKKRKKAAKSSS